MGELNVKVQTLGRPAKNFIARSGGLLEILKQCPELTVTDDKVEVSLNSVVTVAGELDPREASPRLNQLSSDDVKHLNRNLTKFQIGPKSSALVSVLQKRGNLVELKRQCDMKRSEIEALKQRVRAEQPDDAHDARERLRELKSQRNAAVERLSEKESFLEEKSRLEKLLIKLDREIESREDKLERLKLKIRYNQEKVAMFEQDLFFESRQHETLTHELLQQHSSDLKKLEKVFEVLVREKSQHSREVLEAHITALEGSDKVQSNASRICRRKIAEIEQTEGELLRRIREHQLNLQAISQLELISIDSIRSPLFEEKVTETPSADTVNQATGHLPESSESSRDGDEDAPSCAICLTDLTAEPSERLDCSHNFHSSCLAEMYSSGTSHCPLCRRYEPSSADFPTL